MELWDIYDVNRNLTGRTMKRGELFQKGDYHLVVHICVFNSEGKMLIQQRQPFKEGWSDYWDITVGGSAVQGDDSRKAAHRELLEEVGMDVDFSELRPNFSFSYDNGFDDFYFIERDADCTKLKLQYEEVQRVRWAEKDEILAMIAQGIFIPYYDSLIELCFESRHKFGSCRV